MSSKLPEIIENEWYLVRYSGETPEIAFNSAIYYLTRSEKGPGIRLSEEQSNLLLKAAVERYSEIIVRDLMHSNHDTPIYRGISRSIVNYRRFCVFCGRHKMQWPDIQNATAQALLLFLETEVAEIQNSGRPSIIDCTYTELKDYAAQLGGELRGSLAAIEAFCLRPKTD